MASTAGQSVGDLYYEVTLQTQQLLTEAKKVEERLQRLAERGDGLQTTFNRITGAIKVYAAAMAALQLVKLADEFRLLQARVEVAAGSVESGGAAFAALVRISRDTQTSLAGNIEVFNRLNQSLLQMGGTQQDTLNLTELLGKAIKVSGANAVEAKSAMLQFGQALGSGKLAGDELRSLLENAPYLMRQLATGIGVPIGALKKLGEEGKLTADVVVNALTKARAQIDADFKKFPQTFESAFQVARDNAALAIAKFDELSGSSAVLTGVTKGLGEVFEKVGDQLAGMNDQAGKLNRDGQIRTWADVSRNALSYLVDAADQVWQTLSVLGRNVKFVFEGIGTEIGGIGAQIAAVARGDFAGAAAIGDAMKEDAERRRRELDESDAKTLASRKLFGQQMREAWDQGAGGGRGKVNPTLESTPTKLKAPAPEKSKFDAGAYLAGLEKATLDGVAKVDAIEREALRKNTQLLKEGKITRQQAAQAVKLIEANAAQDRLDIQLANAEGIRAAIEKQGLEEIEQRKALEQRKSDTLQLKAGSGGINDQEAAIRAKAAIELAAAQEAQARDIANAQVYADQKVAIEEDMNRRIAEMRANAIQSSLSANAQAFGALTDALRGSLGEQNGIYKAAFLAQKAFSIASSIVAIQTGVANAAALPFPANLGAMATVVAATASIISTIAGTNYGGGRQYGGPASAGSMYRVNETGRPEMFTASNGQQFMLPTTNGNVTPANEVGGAGSVKVEVQVINNHPTAQVQAGASEDGKMQIFIGEAASQISERRGPMWAAMQTTNVQGRIS